MSVTADMYICVQTYAQAFISAYKHMQNTYIPFPGIVKLLVEDTATALSVSIPAIVVTVTTRIVCGMSG